MKKDYSDFENRINLLPLNFYETLRKKSSLFQRFHQSNHHKNSNHHHSLKSTTMMMTIEDQEEQDSVPPQSVFKSSSSSSSLLPATPIEKPEFETEYARLLFEEIKSTLTSTPTPIPTPNPTPTPTTPPIIIKQRSFRSSILKNNPILSKDGTLRKASRAFLLPSSIDNQIASSASPSSIQQHLNQQQQQQQQQSQLSLSNPLDPIIQTLDSPSRPPRLASLSSTQSSIQSSTQSTRTTRTTQSKSLSRAASLQIPRQPLLSTTRLNHHLLPSSDSSATPPHRLLNNKHVAKKTTSERHLSQKFKSHCSINENDKDAPFSSSSTLTHSTSIKPFKARRAPIQQTSQLAPTLDHHLSGLLLDPSTPSISHQQPSSFSPSPPKHPSRHLRKHSSSSLFFPLPSRQRSPIMHEAANDVRRNMARQVLISNSNHLSRSKPSTALDPSYSHPQTPLPPPNDQPSHPYPSRAMSIGLQHPHRHPGAPDYSSLPSSNSHLDHHHHSHQQHRLLHQDDILQSSHPDPSSFQTPSVPPPLKPLHNRQLSNFTATATPLAMGPTKIRHRKNSISTTVPTHTSVRRSQSSLGVYGHHNHHNPIVSDDDEILGHDDGLFDRVQYPQQQQQQQQKQHRERQFYVHEDSLHQPTPTPRFDAQQPPPLPPQPKPMNDCSPCWQQNLHHQPSSSSSSSLINFLPDPKNVFTINGTSYHRQCLIGKGGSSKVWRVIPIPSNNGHHHHHRESTTKQYAIKIVSLKSSDRASFDNFCNEIQLLKRLEGHERIIRLEDHLLDHEKKKLFLVMELGETDLNSLLNRQTGKAVSFRFIKHIWEQMLEAVHTVHEEGIIHTDLKPANFVLVQGTVKLIDFGIAKAVPSDDTTNISRDTQIGTANYMSPEALSLENFGVGALEQKKVKMGRGTDVWALGCILYQMIYGSTPFARLETSVKIAVIKDPHHQIDYPETVIPIKTINHTTRHDEGDEKGENKSLQVLNHQAMVKVEKEAIETIKACLRFKKEERPKIPELLKDRFLIGYADGISMAGPSSSSSSSSSSSGHHNNTMTATTSTSTSMTTTNNKEHQQTS